MIQYSDLTNQPTKPGETTEWSHWPASCSETLQILKAGGKQVMDGVTIGIIVAVVVVLGLVAVTIAAWFFMSQQRTKALRARFGPEYDRALKAEGTAKQAEQILQERQQRVAKLEIKALSEQQRNEFAQDWEHEQARFVDNPVIAVANADRLVKEVMRVRGYPVTDFQQRVADVSVDHPVVAQNYRLAHDIAIASNREDVGIEKLRQAMIHYRALFADLLHDGGLNPVRQVFPAERSKQVALPKS
jgi:hypothetical protein